MPSPSVRLRSARKYFRRRWFPLSLTVFACLKRSRHSTLRESCTLFAHSDPQSLLGNLHAEPQCTLSTPPGAVDESDHMRRHACRHPAGSNGALNGIFNCRCIQVERSFSVRTRQVTLRRVLDLSTPWNQRCTSFDWCSDWCDTVTHMIRINIFRSAVSAALGWLRSKPGLSPWHRADLGGSSAPSRANRLLPMAFVVSPRSDESSLLPLQLATSLNHARHHALALYPSVRTQMSDARWPGLTAPTLSPV